MAGSRGIFVLILLDSQASSDSEQSSLAGAFPPARKLCSSKAPKRFPEIMEFTAGPSNQMQPLVFAGESNHTFRLVQCRVARSHRQQPKKPLRRPGQIWLFSQPGAWCPQLRGSSFGSRARGLVSYHRIGEQTRRFRNKFIRTLNRIIEQQQLEHCSHTEDNDTHPRQK